MNLTVNRTIDRLSRLPIPIEIQQALFGATPHPGVGRVLELDVIDGKLIGTPVDPAICEGCGRTA